MKKLWLLPVLSFFCLSTISAYNPPAGGQSLHNLSSPTLLTGGASAAGTGIFNVTPDSIVNNPALPSFEQRVQLDTGFTALISTESVPFNAAFQTGIMIPGKWGVFTGLLNGVFCNADEMDLGNSFNLKAGVSKEITQKVSVGMNLTGGYFWGADSDWSLAADFGALYRRENLGKLKDFRIGVSILNLGKMYSSDLPGIDEDNKSDWFPSIATLKTGVAAVFVKNSVIEFGGSLNVTVPAFQNGIFDAGLQLGFKDVVYLSVAEKIDIKEVSQGHNDYFPAIGLSFKFVFDSKNNSYLKSHDWDKSEFTTSVAWQQKYDTMEAISGDLNIKLGLQDTKAPVIELWSE